MPASLRMPVDPRGKAEEDEKSNDCFTCFVGFFYFGICRYEHPSGRWHDEGRLVVGSELRMDFYDHYRDSHYCGYLFDNGTKGIT